MKLENHSVFAIAGLNIEIDCPCKTYMSYCSQYATDAKADFTVCISDDDINSEIGYYKDCKPTRDQASLSCIYRAISTEIIKYGGFFMHSASIEYDGKGIAFLAPSGTGKSTHIKLWKKILGDKVQIINGDKPIVRKDKDGTFYIYGTPWAGKEGWQRNARVPLASIVFLERGDMPSCNIVNPSEAAVCIMKSTIIPRDAEHLAHLLESVDLLVEQTNAFRLYCNTKEESAIAAFKAITGKKYEKRQCE